MKSRRPAIVLAVALFLTVLSSWIPIFLPARGLPERKARDPGDNPTHPTWELWREHAPGRDTIAYWRMQISGLNASIPVADFERAKVDLNELPRHLRPAKLADLDLFAVYTAAGWPMRALSCAAEDVSQSSKRRGTESWRIETGLYAQDRGNLNPRILPLRPIWPGFLINTAVYTAAVAAVFMFIRDAKHRLRSRRGLCAGCAYSRTGLATDAPCPECGRRPSERARFATPRR